MGQQQFITGWDWLRANRHYNCPGAWSTVINAEELSKAVPYEHEYVPEEDTEDIQVIVAKDVVPQEDVVADAVSVLEDTLQDNLTL